jgi:hypothetical protein
VNDYTICTNPTLKAPTLAELKEIMRQFAPAERETFHVHPKTMRLICEQLPAVGGVVSIMPLRFQVSDLIPERDMRDQWFPPAADKFVEYGPEDEHWMRPLGLGTVEKIDMGPLILAMKDRIDRIVTDMVFGEH